MLRHLTVSKVIVLVGISIFSMQLTLPEIFTSKALAQSQVSLQNTLDDAIHRKLKDNDQPSHKSQYLSNLDITSPEKIPNQNLYLRTLNSYTQEISPSIYEGMSLVTGLPTSDLRAIIELDDLSSLQRNTADIRTTQVLYTDLIQLYEQEKEFFRRLARIRQEAAIYEIFTDNNTQNSGFDLISDLNEIEQKLFQDQSPTTISYSNPERSNFWNNYNSQPFVSNFSPVNFTSFNTPQSPSQPQTPSNQNPSNPSSPVIGNQSDLPPSPEFQFPSIEYGSVCQISPEFKEELDIFQSENSEDSGDSTSSNGSSGQTNSTNSNNQATPSPNISPQTQAANYTPQPFQINFNSSSQNCPADQVFCFTQELKYNTVGLIYPEGSDCVSCIVNRLNQNLQTLLDNGVLPQKITGNFAEPAICKKAAYGDIGLSLNIFSKPILPELPNANNIQSLSPNTYERQANTQKSISNSGFSITEDSTTQRDLNVLSQTDTQEFIAQFDQSLNTDFANNSQVAQAIQVQQQHFDSLSQQINTLNLYFESFNTSLDQINQNFIELINLPECSAL